jgi:D-threonate/D-erythronate kinase
MIAVIADDFTGAAELAGLSLRYGLRVTLCAGEVVATDTDVLVVSTNSRSMNKTDALAITKKLIEQIQLLKPEWIYKKTDSVLRGYVLDELRLQMEITGKQKTFLMPANPSLGRTIKNGTYFINAVPISNTDFATDPEFPVISSFIKDMLDDSVSILTPASILPQEGIVTGEATNGEEVATWASVLNNDWLLAGAGDFFVALLERKYKAAYRVSFVTLLPFLYISGTAFGERKEEIRKWKSAGRPVLYLEKKLTAEWLTQAASIINQSGTLLLAIDETHDAPDLLRARMAWATREIVKQGKIKEMFIEGGSTAAAILDALTAEMLIPVNEWSRGVVRMKAGNLFITVKPGSYPLPELVRRLFD